MENNYKEFEIHMGLFFDKDSEYYNIINDELLSEMFTKWVESIGANCGGGIIEI